MNFKEKLSPSTQKKLSDLLFILYAGGAALLSYSLVYALRKPFTALQEALNKALAELKADGTIQYIIDKYISAK